MAHTNPFITFLRMYGPITTSDNMYDELIQNEIEKHKIDPPIQIDQPKLNEIINNFMSGTPKSVILTGTAGDGKTFLCRNVWRELGGSQNKWAEGKKRVSKKLTHNQTRLTIIKDMSELTNSDKRKLFREFTGSLNKRNKKEVFLIAANDGQLLNSWRVWEKANNLGLTSYFNAVENFVVDGESLDPSTPLHIYNLSHGDTAQTFQLLVDQILNHSSWEKCKGCDLLSDDGNTSCPIRLNRERLGLEETGSTFRTRFGQLLTLAQANRFHFPIRDLLLLIVNVLLGIRNDANKQQQPLLTCKRAINFVNAEKNYAQTNPYANVFGKNLRETSREKYNVFNTLGSFGIGRESSNSYDDLLIFSDTSGDSRHNELVNNDKIYGYLAYKPKLLDYREGPREDISEFMQEMERQRQRLFFTVNEKHQLDPWHLTVFRYAGDYLKLCESLKDSSSPRVSNICHHLIRGINRTFCGKMIDDDSRVYLGSSGGSELGRTSLLLKKEINAVRDMRLPCLEFALSKHDGTPEMRIFDPYKDPETPLDQMSLRLPQFEFLQRVSRGSLPMSFSRQCCEDFISFKLRIMNKIESQKPTNELTIDFLNIAESGHRDHDSEVKITLQESLS